MRREFCSHDPPRLVLLDLPWGRRISNWCCGWGGHHPFFLQMAAYYVFEAQMLGRDEAWIQRQFDDQAHQHYRGWPSALRVPCGTFLVAGGMLSPAEVVS